MPTMLPGGGQYLTPSNFQELIQQQSQLLQLITALTERDTKQQEKIESELTKVDSLKETVTKLLDIANATKGETDGISTIISSKEWHYSDGTKRPGMVAAINQIRQRQDAATEQIERLVALVEDRLGEHHKRQIEAVVISTTRPGAKRQMGSGVIDEIESIRASVTQIDRRLGTWQGGAASTTGAIEHLAQQMLRIERSVKLLSDSMDQIALKHAEQGDTIQSLVVQQQPLGVGNDAFGLLAQMLRSPNECPPLFRKEKEIIFEPRQLDAWLEAQGLTGREADQVRRTWKETGYSKAEKGATNNQRIKIPGLLTTPYFGVFPVETYAKLRIPIPTGLPLDPPSSWHHSTKKAQKP